MSDHDPSNWFTIKETLIASLGFIVTLGGVFGGIQWRRFLTVEKKAHNSISREEHQTSLQNIEKKIEDGFKSIHQRQDDLMYRLLGPIPSNKPHTRFNNRSDDQ